MRTTRRELLLGTAGTLAATALPAFARASDADAPAQALIDRTAETFLALYPENATSLGVDKGARAPLKHQLADRSPEGQRKIVGHLRQTLAEIGKLDAAALSPIMRTNVEVVQ